MNNLDLNIATTPFNYPVVKGTLPCQRLCYLQPVLSKAVKTITSVKHDRTSSHNINEMLTKIDREPNIVKTNDINMKLVYNPKD